MSLLTDLNEFHMDKAGVYYKSESHDFAYSDGAQAEQKLQDVLSTTTNLASCLLYTSPSPRDQRGSRMPSSA